MSKKSRVYTFSVILALAVVLSVTESCKNKDASAPFKLRMSVAAFQDTLIPIIGVEKGWYKDEGVDVEIMLLPWYSVQEALASGTIDVGINNISSIIGSHHNFPENIYYYGFNTFDNGFAIMIRPNGRLKSSAQLEKELGDRRKVIKETMRQLIGKTVITTSRTDMEQVVAFAARSADMDFNKDIKIQDMEPDEGLAAFLSGAGDAYVGGIPQRTRALKEGYMEMISGPDLGPSEINGLTTTKKFAESHQEELLKVLKVIFKIIQFVNSNKDEGGGIIISELNRNTAAKFTLGDFKNFWNNFEHYAATPTEVRSMILSPDSPTYWKSRWDDTNFYFHRTIKTIPKPVTPEEAFWMEKTHVAYLAKYGN